MNSNGSGARLERFFNGKGFYIVLFLCAAVIGASAWMMAAGERAMVEEISVMNPDEGERVETVVVPPQEQTAIPAEVLLPEEEPVPTLAEEMPAVEPVWNEAVPISAVYVWPVSGAVARAYSTEALAYDITMRDWRTHDGIDIAAAAGTPVSAAHAGMVQSVRQDDLLGTVVTVDHGDGAATVYANLEREPAVSVGSWVEPGSPIGAVGSTALCEIGQESHLHFSLTVDGHPADPLAYLPG